MRASEDKAARAAAAGRGHEFWTAARRLGGELHLEYTFAEFVLRTLALEPEAGPYEPRGLDLSYEQLQHWDDVVGVLSVNDQLTAGGVPEGWQYIVSVGMRFFDSGYRARDGRLPLPAADDPFRGRHSVGVLGVSDEGELAFANSWGRKWGDDGIGYISRLYFEEHVDSVLVTRLAWLGPSGEMDRDMARRAWTAGRPGRALPRDFVESWSTGNRRQAKEVTIDGETFDLLKRVSFSAARTWPRSTWSACGARAARTWLGCTSATLASFPSASSTSSTSTPTSAGVGSGAHSHRGY